MVVIIRYACNAPTPEAEQYMLSRLCRKIVIADWQYGATVAPVETASVFTNAGFDCLLCPWDRGDDRTRAVMTTVKEQRLMGFMHTTWHTISRGMPYVTLDAVSGFEEPEGYELHTRSAALWRKVMPCGGSYARAGWSKVQIDDLC